MKGVHRFTAMIYAQLDKALTRRWSTDGKYNHYDGVGEEPYIEVSRRVKLKTGEEAGVSVGVGWGSDGTYLYVYCWDGPVWAKRPNGHGFERERQWNVLSHPCEPTNAELDHDIDRILAEFEDALRHPAPMT